MTQAIPNKAQTKETVGHEFTFWKQYLVQTQEGNYGKSILIVDASEKQELSPRWA